jgi:hypothetical protein
MSGKQHAAVLLLSAALAAIAYFPALGLPFISDDYIHIEIARKYSPPENWGALWDDILYRSRATSSFLSYWIDSWFGLSHLPYNIASLVLHILVCWLIYSFGAWRAVGWSVSAAAACYFAVQEGHQEAVMWFAAVADLLVTLFVLLSVYFWVRWMQGGRHRMILYFAALASFILALFSKESAVTIVPLLALVVVVERGPWRQVAVWLVPFALLAVLYTIPILTAGPDHQHLGDGTFSLAAPFWLVIPRSGWRILWFWGLGSLALLAIWRTRVHSRLVLFALGWIGIGLIPYSFLLYMPYVPSRHTYLASAGLAMIVGAGWVAARAHFAAPRWAALALAAVIVAHNWGYLWARKVDQFARRAEPTEKLVDFARKVRQPGDIYVSCFPFPFQAALDSVRMRVGDHVTPVPIEPGSQVPPERHIDFCVEGKEPKL